MAVEGVVNLVQNLADRLFGQGSAVQAASPLLGAKEIGTSASTEDTFTPSTQSNSLRGSAQDAGIFQLSAPPLTTVAQPGSDANLAVFPPQAGSSGAAPNSSAPQASQGVPSNSGANAAQIGTGPAAAAELQNKIQTLNASLPALGLTNGEIEQIDRIASMIKDFNPAAYADLVSQFEALAQQAAQQKAAGAASVSPLGLAETTSVDANANNGGFQVQQALTHFTEPQVTANGAPSSGGTSPAANPTPIGVTGLQSEQVQFTLSNASGQSAQVQVPSQGD